MNSIFKRLLKLELPARQSAFLWGARKTGKSTYLKKHFPKSRYYDLLKSDVYLQLAKAPHILREEILAMSADQLLEPIIIDEIQKVPILLDEIHWLIENTAAYFILCGSSARKLKRDAANLLGGRAWGFNFYPLVSAEINNFDLLRAFNNGLIPTHYLADNPRRFLRAYVNDYLTEEIQQEGLTRNLPAFARFLDQIAFSQGELTNFNNIARDCAIDAKTVKAYYQILEDTLLGYFIYPFSKQVGRVLITATPKFYLFDVGVANFLAKRNIQELRGVAAGNSFESFILMELMAYSGITESDWNINFWRTKTGLEVDFVLNNGAVAIEVKISSNIVKSALKGMIAFVAEHKPKQSIVVCLCERARKITLNNDQYILLMPWRDFLQKLWSGEIIKPVTY